MKIIRTIIFFSIIFSTNAQQISLPKVTREVLNNGLVVLLMEQHRLPIVSIQISFKGGSANDPVNKEGIANLMSNLLKSGTAKRSAKQIAEEIDFVGGKLEFSTKKENINLSFEVMKKDFDGSFALLSDVILNANFLQNEIDREKKMIYSEFEEVKEDPSSIAQIAFVKEIFQSHPYGFINMGKQSSLEKITRDDLIKHYKTIIAPNRAVMAVVGDFNTKEMLKTIKNKFGAWKESSIELKEIAEPKFESGQKCVVVNKSDATQTQIRIGGIGVARKNENYFAIQVANSIFGNGFTSRLVDEIRVKRSLSYGASSGFTMYKNGGSFLISTFTKNETVKEVVEVILTEIKKYREIGPTSEEIAKAKNYLIGDMARDLQTPDALASNLCEIEIFNLPKDYLEKYFDNLRNVNEVDVKKVINNYFQISDATFLFLSPKENIEKQISNLGKIKTIEMNALFE